ncbi:hypothetical protein QTL97_14550 [Sporosarcina thermotolerans]|uniref:Adhesin n=1 Tax=Sporosarcina thermotolerans TaxID=633404 RepID=A0AAW9AGH5_9BACL|nr:hypothetical protein [Sporosarcina thermotolerans]MDW0118151.1 hypothetical protein [Sporosarcina thermotolerans]WHT47640.1 hypothetical protein QNH10_16090 [Sporosarcina thermotolerans]
MKSLKIFAASVILATTTSFSTVFAEDLDGVKEFQENLPDWYWTADRINPNNPDLENLPPSKVEFQLKNLDEISTLGETALVGGTGSSYIMNEGSGYYAINATYADTIVVLFQVIGTLYKQPKGSTGLTIIDIASESKSYTKGMVVAETTSPSQPVGTTMLTEGVHYINMPLISETKVTTDKLVVK